MIPKIIHYCWFGNNAPSDMLRACVETWHKVLPDYEIREWSDKDLSLFYDNTYVMQAYRARNFAFVSDVVRLHALFAHGGIYLDTDVEVRRPFDAFLKNDFFIGSERCGTFESIGTAVIGAAPGNDIIKRMLDVYKDIPFCVDDDHFDKTPNTVRLRPVLEQMGCKQLFTEHDPIKISKKAVIYPVNYFCLDTPDSYAVHHFAGSWCDPWKRQLFIRIPVFPNVSLTFARYKPKNPCTEFTYPPNMEYVVHEKTTASYKKFLVFFEVAEPYANNRKERFHRAVEKSFAKHHSLTRIMASLCVRMVKELLHPRYVWWGFGAPDDIAHVLIRLGGGLGDIIIALNYVKHFAATFAPDVRVSISVPRAFKKEIAFITRDLTEIAGVFTYHSEPRKNDLILSLVRTPVVTFAERAKLSTVAPKLYEYVRKLIFFAKENGTMLVPGTVADKLLQSYTQIQGRTRVGQADVEGLLSLKDTLKITPPENAAEIREKFFLPQKYITLQYGVGKVGKRKNNDPSTNNRLCKIGIFYDIAAALKKRYPDHTLVQIGLPGCDPIRGVDVNLCGETTFQELLSLLDGAALHVSCEGGTVHMRHFMSRKPSLVLFGPTDETFYGYPENINIASRLCPCPCEWVHDNWEHNCLFKPRKPVGYTDFFKRGALCMQALRAKEIVDALDKSGAIK